MSTVDRPRAVTDLSPLAAGEHLDQPTFHARYEAMPPQTWAELIGGVVHMPPIVGSDHADVNLPVAFWLGSYQRSTPGVRASINGSVVLNDRNEVQPDCSLRILAEYGGGSTTLPRWIEGAPELVIEIARSSRSVDLGSKLEEYRLAGVKEYLVFALDPNEVFWHVRRGDRFEATSIGGDQLYRSETFPGLWLDASALFRLDLDGLVGALERGLASPEHARFVESLAEARRLAQ